MRAAVGTPWTVTIRRRIRRARRLAGAGKFFTLAGLALWCAGSLGVLLGLAGPWPAVVGMFAMLAGLGLDEAARQVLKGGRP
jgi:hypothetical protein